MTLDEKIPTTAAIPGRVARSQSLTSSTLSGTHTLNSQPSSRSSSPAQIPANEHLVRRHHTLSTGASRLIRGERNKVRLALQGVGLSEEDQRFYLPDSPVSATSNAPWAPQASFQAPSQSSSNPTEAFVMLRGSKGTAPTIDRTPSDSTTTQIFDQDYDETAGRNSLLAEGQDDAILAGDEDWERSLRDEQARLFDDDDTKDTQYAPLPTSPSYQTRTASSFTTLPSPLAHSRSQTARAMSTINPDAWLADSPSDSPALRHRPSLNFQPSPSSSIEQGADRWGYSDFVASNEDRLLSGVSLTTPSFSASRIRSGTAPPGLSLSLSLNNHSRATSASQRSSSPGGIGSSSGGSLNYSTSLNSHHSQAAQKRANSLSLLTHGISAHSTASINALATSNNGGGLSPIGVYPRSPWSPTYEEAKELGMNDATLTRVGSGSSRGSGSKIVGGQRVDEVDSPDGSNGSSGFEEKRANASAAVGGAGLAGMRRTPLPPLQTSADVLAGLQSGFGATFGSTAIGGAPDVTGVGAAGSGTNERDRGTYVQSFLSRQGPASAAALFAPQIGHSHIPPTSSTSSHGSIANPSSYGSLQHGSHLNEPRIAGSSNAPGAIGAAYSSFTALPLGNNEWTRQRESVMGSAPPFIPTLPTLTAHLPSTSTSHAPIAVAAGVGNGSISVSNQVGTGTASENWPPSGGFGVGLAIRQQEQISILQNQMQVALQAMDLIQSSSQPPPLSASPPAMSIVAGTNETREEREAEAETGVSGPIDIAALIAEKGYNPATFDAKPIGARFFVIKSYTEEDVHKSLKYGIWASTDLGNKRLDRAYRESGDKGPIYLFFSVNASGHFAGMAQMLSPVDYATSSTVWASDKWKGVLKVRWIYIKDVPLASLRHIRLSNTPENKPVTSSRDTQEVPYDAGCEVLRILSTYESRTSLLQDFSWYDQRGSEQANGVTSAPLPPHYQPQQHHQQQQQQQQQHHPQQGYRQGPPQQNHFYPQFQQQQPHQYQQTASHQQQHPQHFTQMQGAPPMMNGMAGPPPRRWG